MLWAVIAVGLLTGCSFHGAADPLSPTGGIAMEMQVAGEGNLAALYRVQPDGKIQFGGGAEARNRRITWTGQMTAREIQQLRELLEQYGWFDTAPTFPRRDMPKPKRSYRLTLSWPGGRWHRRVRGASPQVTEIHDLLEQIARRRLEGHRILEALPTPSSQPK